MNISFLQKKISLILIITIFSLSGGFFILPQKAEAQISGQVVPVGDLVNYEFHAFGQLKEQGLDVLAWVLAKAAINALTSEIVGWVNSGFDGNPAFIQNPLRFAQSLGDDTALWFFDQAGEFLEDAPFGDKVVQGLVFNYTDNYFGQSYDLDEYSSDPEAFLAGDFSKGGWDAWFAVNNNPSNNFLGSYIDGKATKEVITERVLIQEFTKLEYGDGFQSVEDEFGNILTPGTLIKSQLGEVLGSGLRSLENADELSEVIGSLVGTLVQKLFSSDGLVGASSANTNESSLIELLRQAAIDEELLNQ